MLLSSRSHDRHSVGLKLSDGRGLPDFMSGSNRERSEVKDLGCEGEKPPIQWPGPSAAPQGDKVSAAHRFSESIHKARLGGTGRVGAHFRGGRTPLGCDGRSGVETDNRAPGLSNILFPNTLFACRSRAGHAVVTIASRGHCPRQLARAVRWVQNNGGTGTIARTEQLEARNRKAGASVSQVSSRECVRVKNGNHGIYGHRCQQQEQYSSRSDQATGGEVI